MLPGMISHEYDVQEPTTGVPAVPEAEWSRSMRLNCTGPETLLVGMKPSAFPGYNLHQKRIFSCPRRDLHEDVVLERL